MMTVDGRDDGWVMTMAYIRFCAASKSSCFFSSDEVARVTILKDTRVKILKDPKILLGLWFEFANI